MVTPSPVRKLIAVAGGAGARGAVSGAAASSSRAATPTARDRLEDGFDLPAINLDHGAGDETGPLGGEERHHRRQFLRAAYAAQRHVARPEAPLRFFLGNALARRERLREFVQPVRGDGTGTHGVDQDA